MAKADNNKSEEACFKKLQTEEEIKFLLPVPPDGGYGWVIVLASFMCNMVVDGIAFTFGLIMPFLTEEFGSSKGTTAWVGSIFMSLPYVSGPLVSALSNKFGCRIVSVAGCALGSIALALSTLCPSIPTLIFVYSLMGGISFGMIYLPAVVMVGYYFEMKRSLATGIAVCGTGVGAFVFAPLTNFLLNNFGWKTTNLTLAGITLGCAIFSAMMKPLAYKKVASKGVEQPKIVTEEISKATISAIGVYNSNQSVTKQEESLQSMERKDVLYSGSIQNLKEFRSKSLTEYRNSVHISQTLTGKHRTLLDLSILKDSGYIVLVVSTIFTMIGFNAPFVYLVDLAKSKGIPESQGSMLISTIGLTNIVARLTIGFIADFPKINNLIIFNGCLMLGAVGIAAMPLCSSFTTFTIASVCFGISIAGYVSLTSIILVEFLGLDKLTNAFGIIICVRGTVGAFAVPLAGFLYDFLHSYNISFWVAAAGFGLSAVIGMFAPYFKNRQTEEDPEVLAPINVKDEKPNI